MDSCCRGHLLLPLYDLPDSVLFVVSGTKTVALLHPDAAKALALNTRGESAIEFSYKYMYDSFDDVRFQEGGSAYGVCQVVTLTRGRAVYIPSGWWHQVRSAAGTVGISLPVHAARRA